MPQSHRVVHFARSAFVAAFSMGALACAETPLVPPAVEGAPSADELTTASAVVSNTRTPIVLVVEKCGSPAVAVTGTRHDVVRLHFDENGGLHRGLHLNFRLTGESTDGVRYSYSGFQNSQIYFANPPFADMTELRIRMKAQGNNPDFIETFRYHQTINANGEITSSFESTSEGCGPGGSGIQP